MITNFFAFILLIFFQFLSPGSRSVSKRENESGSGSTALAATHLIEEELGDGLDVPLDLLAGWGEDRAVIVLNLISPAGLNRFRHFSDLKQLPVQPQHTLRFNLRGTKRVN